MEWTYSLLMDIYCAKSKERDDSSKVNNDSVYSLQHNRSDDDGNRWKHTQMDLWNYFL